MGAVPDGLSFVYNSIDFGGSSYGVYLTGCDMPFMPLVRLDLQPLGGADGAEVQGATFEHLQIVLHCKLVASSMSDRLAKMRAIAGKLVATQQGVKTLTLDHVSGRQWYARLAGRTGFVPAPTGYSVAFSLSFVCPDPWAIAAAYTTNGPESISGDLEWAFTPTGEGPADPVWTIKNGAAAGSSVSIENETTGELYVWANTLAANAWLRLDREGTDSGEAWSAMVSTDSGSSWTKIHANVTGVMPHLSGEEANTINVLGLTTGTVEVKYRAKYRG